MTEPEDPLNAARGIVLCAAIALACWLGAFGIMLAAGVWK